MMPCQRSVCKALLAVAHELGPIMRMAMASQADSIVQPFLIAYDSTQSLVLFDGENEVACCNLIPPFPDFPSEWSATVEANIVNDGYTYVQREIYSAAQVCAQPHVAGARNGCLLKTCPATGWSWQAMYSKLVTNRDSI